MSLPNIDYIRKLKSENAEKLGSVNREISKLIRLGKSHAHLLPLKKELQAKDIELRRQEKVQAEAIRARANGRPRKPSDSLSLEERQAIQVLHFGHRAVYGPTIKD